MSPKSTRVSAYLEFLETKEFNDEILRDFDQTGFWSLWGENTQSELQEELGERNWQLLEHRLRTSKLPAEQLVYTTKDNQLILRTSYHERPTIKTHKKKSALCYFPNIKLPYHEIRGCLKLSMANIVEAPQLKSVGGIMILNGGKNAYKMTPEVIKKTLHAPGLQTIRGDLRVWSGTKFKCPQLKEITGDIILEDTPKEALNLPKLRKVGRSIFCRGSKELSLPKLEVVGESISGYEIKTINLPKLKEIKELRLDFTKIDKTQIEKIISQLTDNSLNEIKKLTQKHKAITIANPKGPYLYELVTKEKIKRTLLISSNSLAIE